MSGCQKSKVSQSFHPTLLFRHLLTAQGTNQVSLISFRKLPIRSGKNKKKNSVFFVLY